MKRLLACLFLMVTSAAVMAAAPAGTPIVDSPDTWTTPATYNNNWGWWQAPSPSTITWTYGGGDATDFHVQLYDQTAGTWVAHDLSIGGPQTSWSTGALSTSHIYYFQMAAANVDGTGPWTGALFFAGILAGSPVPVPVFDFPDSKIFPTKRPTLNWTAVAGATHYYFGVRDFTDLGHDFGQGANGWVTLGQQDGTSWTSPVDLITDHTFGICCIAGNDFGWGTWTSWDHFYVIDNNKPVAPTITLPDINIDNARRPTTAWLTVDGADAYYLWMWDWTAYTQGNYPVVMQGTYIGGQFGGANPVVPGPVQSFPFPAALPDLMDSHNYRVQVGSFNQYGWVWADWHYFHVGSSTPPPPAEFTAPANNATWQDLGISVQWLTVDRAFKYYVTVDDLDNGNSRVDTTIWSFSDEPPGTAKWWYPTGGLVQDHHYQAQMAAGNDWGWTWNTRIYFQAKHVDPLPPPNVTLPTEGTPDLVPGATQLVQWDAITGATKYYVVLHDYGTGTDIDAREVATNSYTTPALTEMTEYDVQVEAGNPDAWSNHWCPRRHFWAGLSTVPPPPTLTGPTGNNNGLAPAFTWAAVPGATYYWLTVTDTTVPGTAFDGQVGTTTVWPAVSPVSDTSAVLTAGHMYSAVAKSGNRLGLGAASGTPKTFGVSADAGIGVAIHVTIRP